MSRRLHFDRIDSSGTFRSGDIRLDVKFHDEDGNEYIWFPKWDDLQNLYAEAERVEELNPTGDEDLAELKQLKQFDGAVISEIAEIIAGTWTGDDVSELFDRAGYEIEYGDYAEEHAETFPAETGGSDTVRKSVVQEKLTELNQDDYQDVVRVIERMSSEKEHIEENHRRESILYRLNEALKHEGLTVTRQGVVKPIEYEE